MVKKKKTPSSGERQVKQCWHCGKPLFWLKFPRKVWRAAKEGSSYRVVTNAYFETKNSHVLILFLTKFPHTRQISNTQHLDKLAHHPTNTLKSCMRSQLPQLVKRMSDETGPTDSTVLELMQQLDELNRMTMQVSAFGPIPDMKKIQVGQGYGVAKRNMSSILISTRIPQYG